MKLLRITALHSKALYASNDLAVLGGNKAWRNIFAAVNPEVMQDELAEKGKWLQSIQHEPNPQLSKLLILMLMLH